MKRVYRIFKWNFDGKKDRGLINAKKKNIESCFVIYLSG